MTLPSGLCLCHPYQGESDEGGYLPADLAVRILQPEYYYNYKYDRLDDPFYVPMLWDLNEAATENFIAAMGQQTRACFVQNEPTTANQAVRSPESVLVALQALRNRTNLDICGPNASVVFGPGQQWMNQFAQIGGIDLLTAIGIHIHGYNTADQWLAFWHMWRNGWYRLYGQDKPVIITETCGTVANFAQIDMLDAIAETVETDPVLQAAFWYCSQQHFWNRDTGVWEPYWPHSWLIYSNGGMTMLGVAFRELQDVVGQTGEEDHLVYLPSVQGAGGLMAEHQLRLWDCLEFTFAATGYEQKQAKDAAKTKRQRQALARRRMNKRLDSYMETQHKFTAGHQYSELCRIARYCHEEDIETPVYVRWMMLLHEQARA